MSIYYASYTKYKRLCPYCGEHFQTLLEYTALRLGPRIRTCHKCGGAFSSGSLEWPEMSSAQRRKFLFGGLPWFLAFFGFWAGNFVYMGIKYPKSTGAALEFAAGILGAGAALLAIFYLICWLQITLSKRRYEQATQQS